MDKIHKFLENYSNSIKASKLTRKNISSFAKYLEGVDFLKKNKYEFLVKTKGNEVLPVAGLVNIDSSGYSYKNSNFFIARLTIFRAIIAKLGSRLINNDLFLGLHEVSKTPMDMYFGTEVVDNDYTFSFCLIYGGCDKNGVVNYCPYDFSQITGNLLKKAHLVKPDKLRDKIFHLSLNANKNNLWYELYYEQVPFRNAFRDEVEFINRKLKGYDYHFCSSEMFDNTGSCLGKKLFVYLPEGIKVKSNNLEEYLDKFNGFGGNKFDAGKLKRAFNKLEGEITLIGIDPENTLAFYVTRESSLKNKSNVRNAGHAAGVVV